MTENDVLTNYILYMAIITRHRYGDTGFTYKKQDGKTLKDASIKRFIEELVIPPAWTEVEINTDRSSRVYASGRDDAGRKQYVYNPDFVEAQEAKKYERIVRFGRQLETMRRATGQHLSESELSKQKVLACMVRLLDAAYFRPGSPQYSAENETYGLTTMRSKHLTIKDDKLVFEYVGKSSKEQKRVVEDERLARVVAELDELPGYEIFQYIEKGEKRTIQSQDLNEYIKDIMGEDFSAKDFRTWAGTVIAAIALDEIGAAQTKKDVDNNVLKAVKKVAEKLGNTDAVARANYIDPRVIKNYIDGRTISFFKSELKDVDVNSLSSIEERAVLALLKSSV